MKYIRRQKEYQRLNFTNCDDMPTFCQLYYYIVFIFNKLMEPWKCLLE